MISHHYPTIPRRKITDRNRKYRNIGERNKKCRNRTDRYRKYCNIRPTQTRNIPFTVRIKLNFYPQKYKIVR